MKKRILLIVLALTMLLSALALANVASAECTASTSNVNIAKDAEIVAGASASYLYTNKLVDGNGMTATWTAGGDFVFVFDEDRTVCSVGLSINGYMVGDDGAYPTPNKWTYQQTQKPVESVRVQFLSETDEIVWDSGDLDTSEINTVTTVSGFAPYMINSPDVYVARKVRVVIEDSNWGKNPLGEVLIYEGSGAHDWSLTSTTTAATCEEDGLGTYTCTCNATKTDIIPATGHDAGLAAMFHEDKDNGTHYNLCVDCGIRLYEQPHVYDANCEDTDCNLCLAQRVAPGHSYTADCDEVCDNCPYVRTTTMKHFFDADCDLDCNRCGSENPNYIVCQYDNNCDSDCNLCGTVRTVETDPRYDPDHEYDSVCDADCNECGAANPDVVAHKLPFECTVKCNWPGCTYERPAAELKAHTYTNNCDATCNKCGFDRGAREHTYDNDCDPDCNYCGTLKQGATTGDLHVYDNKCDAICNECSYERTVSQHVYTGATYPDQLVAEATAKSDGLLKKFCDNCGLENAIVIPATGETDKGGLGVVGIVLIVVGVVVVILACAFVAVFVLVIKPKLDAKKKAKLEAERKAQEEADDEDDEEYDEDDEEEDEDEEGDDEDADDESND